MAQYGDPQNPDLSRFQRYRPGDESASQGGATNGHSNPGSADSQPYSNQPQGYSASRFSQGPSSPPGAGETSSNGESTTPQTDRSDLAWSQGLSSAARKRNQWRQFQHLRPDFGDPKPAVEPPPAPTPPARNASLPSFTANPRRSRPVAANQQPNRGLAQPYGTETSRPSTASFPSRPVGYGASGTQPTAREGRATASPPNRYRGTAVSAQTSFSPDPGLGRGPQSLQPHPHSTSLSSSAPRREGGSRPPERMPSSTSSKVTPLRRPAPTASSAPAQTRGAAGAAAQQLAGDAIASGQGFEPRTRSVAKPRRRLPKPPMPVLYLIRLVILGVGVAAIAGTLLSVLSPSNLATSTGQDDAAGEVTAGAAEGPLVAGTTASLVSDVALAQDMTLLKAEIEQLAALTPGLTQSVFVVDLDTGDYVDIAGDQGMAAASTVKVPILVAFLQEVDAGNIALNQGLVMQEEQMAGGSGTMQNDPVGTRYTALEVATEMIVNSDNTATNMIVDALGGIEALNQRFQNWGLESTIVRNPLPDLEGTNTTSTRDLVLLMALVDQGGLLTSRSRDRMFSIMQRTVNRSLIPFGINDDSLMANKTGNLDEVLGDVALVDVPNGKRYAISVLVERPENDGRASELIRRTSETAHAELSQPIAPVGGVDPSTPEDRVPDPGSPEEDTEALDALPEAEPTNREQVPQG